MAGDYLRAFGFAAHYLYHLAGDEAVGRAVRAVFADGVT